MKRTYLDWAAATPVSKDAARAFARATKEYGNPSSPHTEGCAAHAIVEDARVRIARLAGVKPDAILFTSGATEANALAILGHVRAHTREKKHVLYLPSAHASTRGCMDMLIEEGVSVEPLVLKDGKIDLVALSSQIRPETVLVALEVVCGETGTRFDVRGVRQVLNNARSDEKSKIHLHADASQLPLVESFQLTRIASDTLSLDSQKVGGVRGIGVLIAPRHVMLSPLIRGGGQERGLRPGTESAGLASAFAAALETAEKEHASFSLRAQGMRARLLAHLSKEIPELYENSGKEHAPHILNMSLIGRDTDYLCALLDEAGFAVSTRSACATNEEGSRAVLALTNDPRRAVSTLRVSWGPDTSARDLERFERALVRAVRFIDANAL